MDRMLERSGARFFSALVGRVWVMDGVWVVGALAAATLTRVAMEPWAGERGVYLAYVVATAVVAHRGRIWPTVVTGVLGGMTARYLFMVPRYSLAVEFDSMGALLAMYVAAVLAVAALGVKSTRRYQKSVEAMERGEVLGEAVFEGVAIAVDGRIEECNAQFASMLGYERNEVLGMEGKVLTGELQCGAEVRGWGEAREMKLLRKDGVAIFVETRVRPIEFRGRSATIAAVRDITLWKEAEARAAARAADMDEAQRLARMGSWTWVIQGDVVSWSPGLWEVLGRERSEAPVSWAEHPKLYTSESFSRLEAAVMRAVTEGESYTLELEVVRPDGEEGWAVARGEAVRDATGKVVKLHGTMQEITEAKRVARKLEKAKREAEQANRAKDRFLAVVSHELRTPLTPIMMAASLLERCADLSLEAREDVETIRRNIVIEARLVDDLLDVARIGSGKLVHRFESVGLHDAIRSAVTVCGEVGARILVEAGASNDVVRGDTARLRQVMWNLVSNARKFTPENGMIRVRTWNDATGGIRVEVADTGIGIASEAIERMFLPFEQGEGLGGGRANGLGLGLSICKEIVSAHGGELTAHSDGPGRGARFGFSLPTLAAEDSAGHRGEPALACA